MAAAVLPATVAYASPQSPEVDTQLTNPGGNPQPPQPPDPPEWGPQDLTNPTENREPPLPPEPPGNGPDELVNPTADPEPPTPPQDPAPSGDSSIPTPQRIDAGFGATAAGSQQAAGLALIAAALLLAFLVVVIAARTRQPVLRLITCGGSFDRATGHYRDNVIVDASAA